MDAAPADRKATPADRRARFPGALAESQFRRFVAGSFLWGTAYQLLTLAQGYTLFQLTDSTAYLAALGATTGVPQVVTPIVGGFLNDRFPRRRLLMAGSLAMLAAMAVLTAVYVAGALEPWHILAAGVIHGSVLGIDWTTRQSMVPSVVSRDRLVSGVAIDLGMFNLARVVAPLAGGMVLASLGGPATYGLIAGLFAANLLMISSIHRIPSVARDGAHAIWGDTAEALKAVWRDQVIGINIVFTAVNGLLVGGIVYLMPAYAKDVVDTGARGLSWLYAALGVGAFAASTWLSISGGIRRAGPGLIASNLVFAAACAAFAISGSLWFALATAIAASFFNTIHISLGVAALQLASSDDIRGRVFGIYEVAWGAFPLGGLALGALASASDLRIALLTGSAAVALFTIAVFVASRRIRSLVF